MSVESLLHDIPPDLVYVVTALVVGVESLGIPVPGEIVLVGAALLTTGPFPVASVHLVAAAAVLGAVLGDSIGYLVGRRHGDRLMAFLKRRFPKHVDDDVLAYAEHVFERHGVWAVFFGRFVALLRIFAGPLAGSLKMRYAHFLAANVLGAVGWAAGTTYAIHYAGAAAEKWFKDFSYVGLGVAVVVGVLLSTVLRRRMRERVESFARQRRAIERLAGTGQTTAEQRPAADAGN